MERWPRRRSGVGEWLALTAQGLGDLRLPDPGKDRQCGWADGLRGLGRDGPTLWVPGALCGLGAEYGPQRKRGPHGGGKAARCGGNAPRDGQAEGLPWRTDGEGGVAVFTDTRPLTAGRPAAVLHVAAGSYGGARDDGSLSFKVERGVHFGGGGPRKCGVLRRARAGDGPGAKLLSCRNAARAGMTVVRRTAGAA